MPKSATAVDPMVKPVKPDPNLEKRIRRVFTGDYKLSIIQQADACKHGELGALLVRNGMDAPVCSSGSFAPPLWHITMPLGRERPSHCVRYLSDP
jgi:hypothetical protein